MLSENKESCAICYIAILYLFFLISFFLVNNLYSLCSVLIIIFKKKENFHLIVVLGRVVLTKNPRLVDGAGIVLRELSRRIQRSGRSV